MQYPSEKCLPISPPNRRLPVREKRLSFNPSTTIELEDTEGVWPNWNEAPGKRSRAGFRASAAALPAPRSPDRA